MAAPEGLSIPCGALVDTAELGGFWGVQPQLVDLFNAQDFFKGQDFLEGQPERALYYRQAGALECHWWAQADARPLNFEVGVLPRAASDFDASVGGDAVAGLGDAATLNCYPSSQLQDCNVNVLVGTWWLSASFAHPVATVEETTAGVVKMLANGISELRATEPSDEWLPPEDGFAPGPAPDGCGFGASAERIPEIFGLADVAGPFEPRDGPTAPWDLARSRALLECSWEGRSGTAQASLFLKLSYLPGGEWVWHEFRDAVVNTQLGMATDVSIAGAEEAVIACGDGRCIINVLVGRGWLSVYAAEPREEALAHVEALIESSPGLSG